MLILINQSITPFLSPTDAFPTRISTLPLIASMATSPTLHPLLPSLSSAYNTSLTVHNSHYNPQPVSRTTILHELAYLSSLRNVEKGSLQRCIAAGVFKGLDSGEGRQKIESAAWQAVEDGKIEMRKGWAEMITFVQRGKGKVVVVSVAWSGRFIRAALGRAVENDSGCAQGDGVGEIGVNVDDIEIRVNEVCDREAAGNLGNRTEADDGGIWTGLDKARVMDSLIEFHNESDPASHGDMEGNAEVVQRPWVVYIGDSTTDLECVLNANVGVCIRDKLRTSEQKALEEVLNRVGVECVHVGLWHEQRVQGRANGREKIYWARDFEEVICSGVLSGG